MNNTEIIKKSLMKRHLAESRFKTYGILGIISATVFLIVILSTIFIEGKSAFKSTYIKLDVFFDPSIIDPDGTRDIDEIRFAKKKCSKLKLEELGYSCEQLEAQKIEIDTLFN